MVNRSITYEPPRPKVVRAEPSRSVRVQLLGAAAELADEPYASRQRLLQMRSRAELDRRDLSALAERLTERLERLGELRQDWAERRRFWQRWRDTLDERGELAGLGPEIDRALEANPNALPAFTALAALHLMSGDDARFEETRARVLELNPRYGRLYAYLQDDVTRKRPTVDLILNLLCSSAEERLARRRVFAAEERLWICSISLLEVARKEARGDLQLASGRPNLAQAILNRPPVLLLDEQKAARAVGARVEARAVKTHQGQQGIGLGGIAHRVLGQKVPEIKRLLAQLASDRALGVGREIALREQQVDDLQHDAQPPGQVVGCRVVGGVAGLRSVGHVVFALGWGWRGAASATSCTISAFPSGMGSLGTEDPAHIACDARGAGSLPSRRPSSSSAWWPSSTR